jgi:hypothetical protein
MSDFPTPKQVKAKLDEHPLEIPIETIHTAIPAIIGEMQAVAKTLQNKMQHWNFRSIDQIKNAVNPMLAKYGVSYAPKVLEYRKERIKINGKDLVDCEVKVLYEIRHKGGTHIESVVLGEASDYGDKAIGKAQTYAEKVMLIQVFCIGTEEQKNQDSGGEGGGAGVDPDFTISGADSILDKVITYKTFEAGLGKPYGEIKPEDLRSMVNWITKVGADKKYKDAKQFMEDANKAFDLMMKPKLSDNINNI